MKSIFIMSSERSGSNLLRMMLGAHSRIAAPPPPHMWSHLTKLLPFYGPLSVQENMEALIADAIRMTNVQNSHLKWKHDISERELGEHPTNLTEVIASLYEAYAAREGADVWCCKENNLFDHAYRIREILVDARFIYLCRDGRDVACSLLKVPTHDQHIYFIAQEWRAEQMKCLQVYQDFAARELAIMLRYEDLIEDPQAVMERICDIMEIAFESRMLEFHKTDAARQEAEKTAYWKNLSRPIIKDNKEKFRRELSSKQIKIFEAVASDLLNILGYPSAAEGKRFEVRGWQRWWYRIQNRLARKKNRRELFREKGRAERAEMLRSLHARQGKTDRPFWRAPNE